ncbi:hypothetical protein [Desulfobotulus sp.]|jgi:hypothetical protein|uniref:hypothetical protein n=1 Tax=Desulfobotulus sp. TaxID=1940337 RepID=UPI002A36A11C|nr:hypothetical protein [Desulfobotulus sp.]MDY0164539.1 hypothetical protein [Desulfobotulus sp.]
MNYKEFFITLIAQFLSGGISREQVAHEVAMELPIDSVYSDHIELMENCEWALRHINEPDYWTTENELQYYLSCLKGDEQFSIEERDRLLK